MEVTIHVNGQTVSVEVSIEVYEYLDATERKEENLAHEQRRHWDARAFDEYIVFTEGTNPCSQSPEQIYLRKETLLEIHAALIRCTEHQRRRFLLYALEDMSCAEIAALYGCSKISIHESIRAVRKKCKKYFSKHPND